VSNSQPANSFDSFVETRIVLPIEAANYAIWPEAEQTTAEWVLGHPLELRPFCLDYLDISCSLQQLKIQPHYDKSTWDTFVVDPTGRVEATAFGGAFPFTLGRQPDLLAGIVAVLKALPPLISDPQTAQKIDRLARYLDQIAVALRSRGGMVPNVFHPSQRPSKLGQRIAWHFWRWKLT
jgi:uncharacterized protein YbdZ (MbtH family)